MKNLLRAVIIGFLSILLILLAIPTTFGMSSEASLVVLGGAITAMSLIVLWATE